MDSVGRFFLGFFVGGGWFAIGYVGAVLVTWALSEWNESPEKVIVFCAMLLMPFIIGTIFVIAGKLARK